MMNLAGAMIAPVGFLAQRETMMTAALWEIRPADCRQLLDEVARRSGQPIASCYQCRRCAAGCPVGDETGFHTPDRLIRQVVMGDRAALNDPLVWKCVSCYTCGARCPNNIQTARITETLKQMAKEAHLEPLVPQVKDFHDAFLGSALRFGRINEVEFMGWYELKNSMRFLRRGELRAIFDEMMSQMKLAAPMVRKGRMHFVVQGTLQGRRELRKLWKKAEEQVKGKRGKVRS